MNVEGNSLKRGEDLNLMNDLPNFKKEQTKEQEMDVEGAKTGSSSESIPFEIKDGYFLFRYNKQKHAFEISKSKIGSLPAYLSLYDSSDKLAPEMELEVALKLYPDCLLVASEPSQVLHDRPVIDSEEQRKEKLLKSIHLGSDISNRVLFAQIFTRFSSGNSLDITHLSLGEQPKHFHLVAPLFVSKQLNDICEDVLALTLLAQDSSVERRRVICGPMGVGKSYITWSIAAYAYSHKRPVLYIADAAHMVATYSTEEIMLAYLVKRFLLLNDDILSIQQKSELSQVTWLSFVNVMIETQSLIVIDEHSYILQEPYKSFSWMGNFILMQALDRTVTLVVAASSHSSFEINYLKNGMQNFKVYVTPPTEPEGVELLKSFMPTENDEKKILTIVRELGHVPRDLYFYSQSKLSLAKFIDERVQQYGLEITNFYNAMKKDEQSRALVAQSIFRLFYYQSYTFDTSVQNIGDFIDLSVCYRKAHTEFIPLSQATARALLLLNVKINSFSLEANIKSQLLMPDKDGFECLIWSLLLRDAIMKKKLTFQPYYLNGTKAAEKMELSFQQFANLEKDRHVPPTYLSQNILYRPWNNFPRWDFVSSSCFFQVSISTFDVHNSDRAKIDLSFGKSERADRYNPNISETLELITGSNDYTTKIDNGTLCVLKDKKVQNLNFIYITLDKPNHPQLFKKYNNLLVLSAREVWGQGLL
jgi:hypothetical protein